MWQLIFSKKKLSAAARTTLQSLLEEASYTCGASLEDLHLLMGIQVVIRDHRCGLYYSVGYEDICIFCAASGDLVVPIPSVQPVLLRKNLFKRAMTLYFPFFVGLVVFLHIFFMAPDKILFNS